ncbi:MAG: GIY-YIG nuclease family protein [Cyanobacteria bacterium SIG27]|nr:GIY-YIG nuclease family protein [Cyanobacteria bacterium SIG27]
MKYYLYILKTVDNTLYCGIARDVLARFEEHKTGKGAKYTRSHKPQSIVYVDIFEDKSLASKEEYRIKKTLARKEKLELIEKNKLKTEKMLNDLKKKASLN